LYVLEPYVALYQLSTATDAEQVKQLTTRFRRLQEAYHRRREYWLQHLYEGPTRQGIAGPVHDTAAEVFRSAETDFLPLTAKADRAGAVQAFKDKLQPLFEVHRRAVERTIEAANRRTAEEEAEVQDQLHFWLAVLVVVSVLTVAAVATLGW